MTEAKLRVETSENMSTNNPFYGSTIAKKVTEETLCRDKDEREDIAPSGIKAVLKIKNVLMDITINRYYLEYQETHSELSRYTAFFSMDEKVYEVCVWFNKDNNISSISLSEWLKTSDFEDGYDADNIYWSGKDFISWISYLS